MPTWSSGHGSGPIRGRLAKRLHVSPFMPMEQDYEWRITEPGDALHVRIANLERGSRVFDATLAMRRRELSPALMTRVLLTYPPMSLAVPARIYANALRLKLKGARYHPHPQGEGRRPRRCLPVRTEGRGAMIERAARGAVHALLGRVRSGRIDLREGWSGECQRFGPDDAALRATVVVRSPDVYRMLVRERSIGLGQAYAEGLWDTDDLVTLFRIGARELRRSDRVRSRLAPLLRPLQRVATLPVLNTRRGARRNIAAHYDLGNEMFELFLDREWMMYSSALFERPEATLEEAQRARLERICRAPRAGARPAPARDRDRLGRPRALRGVALRLPRHHHHDLARAA